jgi:hypothetical protein
MHAHLMPAAGDEPAAKQRQAGARSVEFGDAFELRQAAPSTW